MGQHKGRKTPGTRLQDWLRRGSRLAAARTYEFSREVLDELFEHAAIPVNRREEVRSWLRGRSHSFRSLRRMAKRRLGLLEPLRISIYGGYAGPERAYAWGRALEDKEASEPARDDTLYEDVRRAVRQLRSAELMDVKLRVTAAGATETLLTDDEGYFLVELQAGREEPATEAERWLPLEVEVMEAPEGAYGWTAGHGKLLEPAQTARFAIVSDIDDTVLQSHVRNRLKQAYVTLTRNALKRRSFPGTRELFRELRAGGGQAPVFYLSRSAWNVHPLLEDFIRFQGLPEGPLILRDVGLFNAPELRHGHKARELERLAKTFPDLSFVLVGDSSQADPDIYIDATRDYPGRVLAILIRNVTGEKHGAELAARLESACPDVHTLVFDHADEARDACRRWGLAAKDETSAADGN